MKFIFQHMTLVFKGEVWLFFCEMGLLVHTHSISPSTPHSKEHRPQLAFSRAPLLWVINYPLGIPLFQKKNRVLIKVGL